MEDLSLQQALGAALQYEALIKDVYSRAALDPAIETGRAFFQMMADEEQGHIDFLEHLRTRWQEEGIVQGALPRTRVPSPAAVAMKRETLGKPTNETEHADLAAELAVLEEALALEEQTSQFYTQLVERLPEEQQELFAKLLEIEVGHKVFVQFQIDMLVIAGSWVDVRELTGE